jgi:putative RecB family exonuclease
MCEQVLGRRPSAVRLMYLRSGTTLTASPTGSSLRFVTNRATAVWQALDKACTSGDFRPKPSGLCSFCAFKEWCPEFGGDPSLAAIEAPRKYGTIAA